MRTILRMQEQSHKALIVLSPISLAFGQTCDQLNVEMAALRQTLDNEQRSLSDCNNHLGSCTPGKMNDIRQMIKIAEAQFDLDRAKLAATRNTPQRQISITSRSKGSN